MQYDSVIPAVFLDRPNRFIANIEIDGLRRVAHVKNTGRCREILTPGARIWVRENDDPRRKTRFDVITAQKNGRLINIDASAPNAAVKEWLPESGLFRQIALIRPETTFGRSRFDFYIEGDGRKMFMEVKGATLEERNVVRFPDAPTERGLKHIRELEACLERGFEACVLFVIQMKDVDHFEPNRITHKAFGDALYRADCAGVQVLARDCRVTPDSMEIADPVPVRLPAPAEPF